MTRSAPSPARITAVMGITLLALLATAPPSSAATRITTMVVEAPRSVRVGQPFSVVVAVHDSLDLGGYETTLLFDQRAAHFGGVAPLRNGVARLGRDVVALGHQEVRDGVSFGFWSCPAGDCVTRRAPAAGLGHRARLTLSRIELTADRRGTLELRFAATRFVDDPGHDLSVAGTDGVVRIRVGGSARPLHSAPAASFGPRTGRPGTRRPLGSPDLDGNGVVTHGDAMAVAYAWTMARVANDPCGQGVDRAADLNGDGCIDVADVQAVVARSSPRAARPIWAPRRPETLKRVRSSAGALPQATQPTSGITFVVNSMSDVADSAPGNGVCRTSGGVCTLRAAIEEANRVQGGATIAFNITSGSGLTKRIDLGSRLPILNNESGPVVIDGYTQPSSSPNTDPLRSNAVIRIEVRGPGESTTFPALYITSADNTVRGLALYRLWRDVWLDGPGAHDNAIVGNFIGTNAAGTYDTPSWVRTSNGAVVLDNGAHHNQIGRPALVDRNVISGGPASGVYHTKQGTNANLVQNNIIGLAPSGSAARPNKLEGVDYNFGASFNQDGGTGPLERNVQSGNRGAGGEASHGTNTIGNRFVGNFVGTDVTGTRVFSYTRNRHFGIHVEDAVGDTVVSDNVICGNLDAGVRIVGVSTRNTTVTRNRIGVTLDGTAAGNAQSGIRINVHAAGGFIAENLIAYNPVGIDIREADNDRFTISRNAIWGATSSSTAPGIDLYPSQGVNLNDAGDGDGGANEQLNFPVIGTAATTLVTATACPGCAVEVFRADRAAGQYGSGQTFVGSATADGNGFASIAVSGLAAGDIVTSTATDADGNTSEFSLNVRIAAEGGGTTYASDAFSRTVTDGWGTAVQGGSWALSGTAADFDVDGSSGLVLLGAPGANRAAHLGAVSARDVDASARVRLDKLPQGANVFVYLVLRRVSTNTEYRAKLRIAASGRVFIQASRVAAGTETNLGIEADTGVTLAAGAWISVRAQATGASPTTLRIRAWTVTEPAAWAYTDTDATAAHQGPGTVGLRAYLGGSATNAPITVRFDDYRVAAP